MRGFQFAHMKTFGRKSGKRQGGEKVWTVADIIAEMKRDDDACPHIDYPDKKPKILAGTCSTFDELEEAHEQACRVKVEVDYTNPKTRKKVKRTKSIRQDTHTLLASVYSLPILSADALADETVMDECLFVLKLYVDFEQARITAAGGEFAMAVIHLDEKHVHIHVTGLDRERGSVNHLHPGKKARDEVRRTSQKGESYGKRAMHDFRKAMCDWQDDVHSNVSKVVGLCRFGPKRARLTRAEWKEVQVARENLIDTRERHKLYEEVMELGDTLQTFSAELDETAKELDREKQYIDSARVDLELDRASFGAQQLLIDERVAAVEQRERKATETQLAADVMLETTEALIDNKIAFDVEKCGEEFSVAEGADQKLGTSILQRIKRAPKAAMTAAKKIAARLQTQKEKEASLTSREEEFEKTLSGFHRGMDLIESDVVEYFPANGDKREGLKLGSNAPKERGEIEKIRGQIRPAIGLMTKFARRIWNSEPGRLERNINADPSMVDVQVKYDREKAIQAEDILKMDVKVNFDKLQGLSKPMKRILGGIANVIATEVGKATIKLARKQMQDEFETLKSYRQKFQKIIGTRPVEEQRSLLSTERKFENMTSKAPDPRDAEKRAREARRKRGEER